MGLGDEIRTGKIAASTDFYSLGMEGADISSLNTPTVLGQYTDYGNNRTNATNNDNKLSNQNNYLFLGLTTRGKQLQPGDITNIFNNQFGTFAGINRIPDPMDKSFFASKGLGNMLNTIT